MVDWGSLYGNELACTYYTDSSDVFLQQVLGGWRSSTRLDRGQPIA